MEEQNEDKERAKDSHEQSVKHISQSNPTMHAGCNLANNMISAPVISHVYLSKADQHNMILIWSSFPNERALTWLVWTEMGNCPSTTSLYSLETGAPKLTML